MNQIRLENNGLWQTTNRILPFKVFLLIPDLEIIHQTKVMIYRIFVNRYCGVILWPVVLVLNIILEIYHLKTICYVKIIAVVINHGIIAGLLSTFLRLTISPFGRWKTEIGSLIIWTIIKKNSV